MVMVGPTKECGMWAWVESLIHPNNTFFERAPLLLL